MYSAKGCGFEPFSSEIWLWFVHSGLEFGLFAMNQVCFRRERSKFGSVLTREGKMEFE